MAALYVIGLTGNIASGKSTVARMLADLGADVIDADEVAHETLAAATEESAAVTRRFGPSVVNPDGSIDRAALARIVFDDLQALSDLEGIVHPGTRRRIFERLERSGARVAVLEAIKLLEGPLVEHVDAIWVVAAPRDMRLQRLVRQRGLSEAEAAQRVDAQNPEDEKVRRADVVLHNEGSLAQLRQQVEAAWRRVSVMLNEAKHPRPRGTDSSPAGSE